MKDPVIKPTHKAIKAYYETLQRLKAQKADHEGAVRQAFQNLLTETAKPFGWTLIGELGERIPGRRVYPDATLRDKYFIPRGYWEAKDTHDKLDVEIGKKIRDGYPITNTIFEDTQTAVLFQNNREVLRKSLTEPKEVAELLNAFFGHVEPNYDRFDKAIDEFQKRVPELALGLNSIIKKAHDNNPSFQAAFDSFYQLCQNSLNPNIRRDAVDEMLIQHLLTERLIRTIFDNADFTRRNVIAVEVEKVITALTSKAFSRDEFLKKLDPFYIAIENAAADIEDFKDKLHFLNKVYERFFQGYSVKVADTHGIVYTPPPIVDFMCASVVEVLKTEFGKKLSDKEVFIIDPATGTGSFIVNLLHRMDKKDLPTMYKQQLFANEVMLLPYYIASLSIEHAYYDLTGGYEPFDGLCFVDTLDLVRGIHGNPTGKLFLTEANTQRIIKERDAPITVIIGNPPYNVGQQNENDNNKNRKYDAVDKRIKLTYAKDSIATNKNALSDVYVKFYRWATDRLNSRDGIVCFVSNNGFLRGAAFDGFRQHLARDFNLIYHFDFKGNARTSGERRRQEGGNIFSDQIRVGVGISILVRNGSKAKTKIYYSVVGDYWKADKKKTHLQSFANVSDVKWKHLTPDARHAWLVPENAQKFASFMPIATRQARRKGSIEAPVLFRLFSRGVATCRDSVAYDFDMNILKRRAKKFIEAYNGEVDRYKRASKTEKIDLDNFVKYEELKWSRDLKQDLMRGRSASYADIKMRMALYRPFTRKHLFFDRILNEEVYEFPIFLPKIGAEKENKVICLSAIGASKSFSCLATTVIPDLHLTGDSQCFPYYFYNEDGRNRRHNITDWALQQFRTRYEDSKISKWDIFYYVYGLLHHPAYRSTFADCLKRELPRIPFAPEFWAFSKAGKELAKWHLNYEEIEPFKLKLSYTKGVPLSWQVEDKMRLTKDKTSLVFNSTLTLEGIPPEVFDYRLGNRSALEWVIDQYQVKKDASGEITSDPNRKEDEEYIVRLVGQVIRVSLETVRIVSGMPEKCF